MKSHTFKNLKAYLSLAGATLATSAGAHIQYTDISDTTLNDFNKSFEIDINGDGIKDFTFDINGSNSVNTGTNNGRPFQSTFMYANLNVDRLSNTYNRISVDSTSQAWQAKVLSTTNLISQSNYWKDPAINNGDIIWSTSNYGTSSGMIVKSYTSMVGSWFNTSNHYMGVKFVVGDLTYYGWVGMDVVNAREITIRDFAYQTCSGGPILAGDTTQVPSDTASMVSASDNADGLLASDMFVSFTKASDETKISEYRIMVVPETQALTFTESKAGKVAPGNYQVQIPNGSNFASALLATTKDVNGNPIAQGTSYQVFVFSVPDGINSNMCILSKASAPVTLVAPAASVLSVTATDVDDNHNGKDMNISFKRPTNEDNIDEYRIMVVKSASATSFDLATANALPAFKYTSIAPTGSNINTELSSSSNDTDGDAITENVAYKVFVLSVGDASATNTLSSESNEVTLTSSAGISCIDPESQLFVLQNRRMAQINWSGNGNLNLDIINPAGQVIKSEIIKRSQTPIIIKGTPGVYILYFTDPNGRHFSKKIVISG